MGLGAGAVGSGCVREIRERGEWRGAESARMWDGMARRAVERQCDVWKRCWGGRIWWGLGVGRRSLNSDLNDVFGYQFELCLPVYATEVKHSLLEASDLGDIVIWRQGNMSGIRRAIDMHTPALGGDLCERKATWWQGNGSL